MAKKNPKTVQRTDEKVETFLTTLSTGTEVRVTCTVRTPPPPTLPEKVVDESMLGDDPQKNAIAMMNGLSGMMAASREQPKPTTEWEIEVKQDRFDLDVTTGKTTRGRKETTLSLSNDEAVEFFSVLATMYARDKDRRHGVPGYMMTAPIAIGG